MKKAPHRSRTNRLSDSNQEKLLKKKRVEPGFFSDLAAAAKTTLEAIYSTTSVHNLLFACIERMALGTHVNTDVFLQC